MGAGQQVRGGGSRAGRSDGLPPAEESDEGVEVTGEGRRTGKSAESSPKAAFLMLNS